MSQQHTAPFKLVVDTNILVSAILSKLGGSARLIELFNHGVFQLITSPHPLRELYHSLSKPRLQQKYHTVNPRICARLFRFGRISPMTRLQDDALA